MLTGSPRRPLRADILLSKGTSGAVLLIASVVRTPKTIRNFGAEGVDRTVKREDSLYNSCQKGATFLFALINSYQLEKLDLQQSWIYDKLLSNYIRK